MQTSSRHDFYAELFLRIARGLVTRPQSLYAAQGPFNINERAHHDDGTIATAREFRPAEKVADTLARYRVVAHGHANDHGLLIGKRASHVQSFKILLRNAAAKRGESCDILIEEGVGQKTAPTPTPLDARWNRDRELEELVASVADDCFDGVRGAWSRTDNGVTIVTLESDQGIPDEGFAAMEILFKAWGRSQGRSVRLERV